MRAKVVPPASFSSDFLRFFRDLKQHNDRQWFAKNKPRYERVVRDACLEFIRAAGPELSRISPQIVADPRPVGGSMFRIYRDIRFSKDKSPYKTHAGLHFTHRMTKGDAHAPGFYLHLEPDGCFAAAGVWHPEAEALARIRAAISNKPREWKKVLDAGLTLEGDALKRPPSGYGPDHPYIEDLKRKDFIATAPIRDAEVAQPTLLATFGSACKTMAPLNAFIAKSMGVPW